PAAKDSYLNEHAILTAAAISNVDAIHPGYGFLSENAAFAAKVEEHGFTFIGPSPEHIRVMGDKIEARKLVSKAGIPCVPGSDGAISDVDEAKRIAKDIGYPVLIKAAAGGGGRGMKVAHTPDEFVESINIASSEALSVFGNGEVYLEKYLSHPRHIEMQILADNYGNVVHLGERDCSLQRRHQKLLEEAPSPALNADQRENIGLIATEAVKKIGYRNVGTMEFLFEDGIFYFIEMNTRLQVEHPVTEMICGIDLVREMIRVSAGAPLALTQEDIKISGHAIECRINAENSETFVPCPGTVGVYHAPGGLGVRVDSGLYAGYTVPPHYDSMIAKLIVHGNNRNECLMRLKRSLREFVIDGLETTIPLHQRLMTAPEFINGDYDIHWLENFVDGNKSDKDKN
ncbi:MAG: acetyl-CoA carboxylase biotin carboxylase subunit, partial [Rhodospirillales bacterium]